MKPIVLALLTLALAFPLRADEALQNGDFSDGITHWHGDGRSPADYASDNPMAPSDPLTSKGLIIPLKHTSWVKVEQDFKTKATSGVLTVTYMVSPDLVLSTSEDDYKGVPGKLGWGWKTFNTPPGTWLVNIYTATGDYDTDRLTYNPVKPGPPNQPQTIRMNLKELHPGITETLSLDVPPGTGTLIILGASVSVN